MNEHLRKHRCTVMEELGWEDYGRRWAEMAGGERKPRPAHDPSWSVQDGITGVSVKHGHAIADPGCTHEGSYRR